MRPIFKPTLRPLWRDEETVQLGAGARPSIVLTGLGPGMRSVLGLLDGRRSERELQDCAARVGVPPDHVARLLRTLLAAGVLDDAGSPDPLDGLPYLRREQLAGELAELAGRTRTPGAAAAALGARRRARVVVHGAGRLGAPLVALLAAAGVGTVEVVDSAPVQPADLIPGGLGADDLGRRRDVAAVENVPGALPRRRSSGAAAEDLTVLAPPAAADPTLPERLRREGRAHLAVEVADGTGIVGPLVLPGVSSCLHCRELHRADRDAQQAPRQPAPHAGAAAAAGTALSIVTVALASIQALAHLDATSTGQAPATVDGTLEIRPPDWRIRRRTWPPHPDCACIA